MAEKLEETKRMTGIKALTTYLKDDPNPPSASEIMAFKKACTEEEWTRYCQEATEIVNS
jgi:hypothetical protein